MRTVCAGRFVPVAQAQRVRDDVRGMIDTRETEDIWLELWREVELLRYRRECQGLWLI